MKKERVVIFNIMLFILITLKYSVVFAGASDIYSVNSGLVNVGALIAGYIKNFAIGAAVFMVLYLGYKMITASPEGKSDARKRFVIVATGVVLLMSMSTLYNWINNNIASQIGP